MAVYVGVGLGALRHCSMAQVVFAMMLVPYGVLFMFVHMAVWVSWCTESQWHGAAVRHARSSVLCPYLTAMDKWMT